MMNKNEFGKKMISSANRSNMQEIADEFDNKGTWEVPDIDYEKRSKLAHVEAVENNANDNIVVDGGYNSNSGSNNDSYSDRGSVRNAMDDDSCHDLISDERNGIDERERLAIQEDWQSEERTRKAYLWSCSSLDTPARGSCSSSRSSKSSSSNSSKIKGGSSSGSDFGTWNGPKKTRNCNNDCFKNQNNAVEPSGASGRLPLGRKTDGRDSFNIPPMPGGRGPSCDEILSSAGMKNQVRTCIHTGVKVTVYDARLMDKRSFEC